MNILHQKLVAALKAEAGTANRAKATDSYTGSTHHFYAVPVPKRREIVKVLIKGREAAGLLTLAGELFAGRSHEEKTIGAMVLTYRQDVRALVDLPTLDRWLGELVGWAEVDALCYNTFTAGELLADFKTWKSFLTTLAHDSNVNKRRAALVFLTHPCAKSPDERLHALANKLMLQLASEKDILITKAISWLLRCQIDTNKSAVADFLNKHETVLPKIAIRETKRKLLIGKKNK